MNRRPCTCRHCATPAAAETAPVAHPPVELPDQPRTFRVHHDGRTQDCTLHPDGTITAVMAGQGWRSALSFDEMRERNWAEAHIEWDPQPLEPSDPLAQMEGAPPVQDAIPLAAA